MEFLYEILFALLIAFYYFSSKKVRYWRTFEILGLESTRTPINYRKYNIIYILFPKLLFFISLGFAFLFMDYHYITILIMQFIILYLAFINGKKEAMNKYKNNLKKSLKTTEKESTRKYIKKQLKMSNKEILEKAKTQNYFDQNLKNIFKN